MSVWGKTLRLKHVPHQRNIAQIFTRVQLQRALRVANRASQGNWRAVLCDWKLALKQKKMCKPLLLWLRSIKASGKRSTISQAFPSSVFWCVEILSFLFCIYQTKIIAIQAVQNTLTPYSHQLTPEKSILEAFREAYRTRYKTHFFDLWKKRLKTPVLMPLFSSLEVDLNFENMFFEFGFKSKKQIKWSDQRDPLINIC